MKTALILLLSLGFAVGRVLMEPHGVSREDVFKDLAHLWVGGLFGAWLAVRSSDKPRGRFFLWTAVALTVVEVVVAVGGRIVNGTL